MSYQHNLEQLRTPADWAQMRARHYGELSALVDSYLRGRYDHSVFRTLIEAAQARHDDEVMGREITLRPSVEPAESSGASPL